MGGGSRAPPVEARRATVNVHVDEDAERELAAAFDWYEERGHVGLGVRFVADVEAALARMVEAPSSFFELLDEGGVRVRRVLLRDIPFQVIFGEIPTSRGFELWVLAVAHLRREPGYWRGRVGSAR